MEHATNCACQIMGGEVLNMPYKMAECMYQLLQAHSTDSILQIRNSHPSDDPPSRNQSTISGGAFFYLTLTKVMIDDAMHICYNENVV